MSQPDKAMSQPAYSMTGFARVSGHTPDGLGYTLSIKSVNHRFLDPQFRLPSGLDALELALRKLLKERLVRGHIDVTLQLERATRSGIQFDRAHLAAYLAAFQQAAAEHSLTAAPDLNHAFRIPGMLTAEGDSATLDSAALEAAVLADADSLIAQLNTMRAHEGAALVAELLGCMAKLEEFVAVIEPLRADVQRAYFDRLRQRIEEITEGASAQLDPQRMQERILQEAAILAERSDIQEELVRLHAHIGHFRELLNAGGELGKKLDFLLQELNREANTLLSKTNGAAAGNGLRITEAGLGIKSVIEKAREQVQNLE
jgi:uncharacterized protein (TIGR00255 family)